MKLIHSAFGIVSVLFVAAGCSTTAERYYANAKVWPASSIREHKADVVVDSAKQVYHTTDKGQPTGHMVKN